MGIGCHTPNAILRTQLASFLVTWNLGNSVLPVNKTKVYHIEDFHQHHHIYAKTCTTWYCMAVASFPGLPHFYLPFVFTIIHGSGRPAKNGERLGAFITWSPKKLCNPAVSIFFGIFLELLVLIVSLSIANRKWTVQYRYVYPQDYESHTLTVHEFGV